jgi:hypothetical protein
VENVRINTDSGSAEQNGLAAAMDAGGNAVIVWADYRNGNADIYAQRLNTSGEQLWPADVHINSDMGAARQTAPTVVVNRNGNAFMMWEDRRNGNRDVYAQGINTVGNKSWLTDLQVVYPDHFYTAVGTAQSLTIDTLSANIHEATLTCNHQANGGDVQFFLTNNGGTDWFTVTPGVTHVFTTTGSDLRWRAELTADPLWPRTPVVNSLRIEYSTQVPYADDYEPDDACSQARPIAVNGAAQSHTFHQNADADWAWFDAVAGATYIVETRNISAHANTVIEPRPTCTAPPAGGGRSFGNGYTISFTAPATGRYYLKVYNHDPAVSGQGTDYTLSVRASRPAAVAVIVAGHDGLNSAQENITFAADRAYRIFRNAGIPIANIRYLAPQTGHDADGDGANDIAGPPTVANVRAAVQDWARERGVALGVPFYLYLVDHGLVDRFKADGDVAANQITAADLNLWLSNLEATTGTDNINVIVDACYSGSFIDETTPGPATVSGRNRVIVASTTSDWMAYGPADGQGLYFSNAFFGALENQQSLWASFQAGSQAVEAQGMLQRPWLDDNGDRRFSSDDGTLATGRALRRVALGGQAPRIEWVSADGRTGLVRAKITDDSGWVGVKVEVFAPSYVPPQPDGNGTTRLINVPVVTLVDLDGDGVYEGRYTFVETGQYRLVAHAEDSEGNLALPMTAFAASDRDHRPVFLPLIPRGH